MKITIKKDFGDDWISRRAGERLRNTILEASSRNKIVEIDFENMTIASTSFFDEGFAKLVDEGWNFNDLKAKIKFIDINERDWRVLVEMCKHRGMKE